MFRRAAALAACAFAFVVLAAARSATAGYTTPGVPPPADPSGCAATIPATPVTTVEKPYTTAADVRVPGLDHVVDLAEVRSGDEMAILRDGGEGSGQVTFVGRRTSQYNWPDAEILRSVPVGVHPTYLSYESPSDRLYVSNAGSCSISVLSGTSSAGYELVRTVAFPTSPGRLVYDYQTGRLFVPEPAAGRVDVFDNNFQPLATLSIAGGPAVAIHDQTANRVWILSSGADGASGRDGGSGSLTLIDSVATPPAVVGTLALPNPVWLVPDSATMNAYVLSDGGRRLTTVAIGEDGSLQKLAELPIDPSAPADRQPRATRAVITGYFDNSAWNRKLTVALDGADHLSLFQVDSNGADHLAPTAAGTAPGFENVVGLEWFAGNENRLFTIGRDGVLTSIQVGPTVQTAVVLPSITYVLPSPLEISLAPVDVARSVGFTAIIMLLLGAPTPIFNGTLSANRRLIERWLRERRRRLPGRRAERADATRTATGTGGAGRAARATVSFLASSWLGLGLYLLVATLVYCFLDPAFPGSAGLRTFGVTLSGILIGTAVSQLPAELYVRRRFGARGRVRVAFWTAALAGGCVLMTRVTGMQPGYVYGIIGGFAFTVALSRQDSGRIAFRGMLVLLAVGVASWFLRIPFQPAGGTAGTAGVLGGDLGGAVNDVLANVFITAIEGAAIGLIPLRFLSGEPLWGWSRIRWGALWGVGLVLFAHVILYPVSSYEPNPSTVGLVTVAATAAFYGAVAMGFWWYFDRIRRRHARHHRAAAPVPATAS